MLHFIQIVFRLLFFSIAVLWYVLFTQYLKIAGKGKAGWRINSNNSLLITPSTSYIKTVHSVLVQHPVQRLVFRDGLCAQMTLRTEKQVTIQSRDDLDGHIYSWHCQDSSINIFDMLLNVKLSFKGDKIGLWSGTLDSHVLKQKGRYTTYLS